MNYPRELGEIHQIELSSFCNLKCIYCPNRSLGREKGYISESDFKKALSLASQLEDKGTQKEVWLHGIGESLLHDRFLEYCALAVEALPNTYVKVSTNGLLLSTEIVDGLADLEIILHISLHEPSKVPRGIVQYAMKAGVLEFIGNNPLVASTNWAGQVDWDQNVVPAPCGWLAAGWVAVQSDGKITTCCLDAADMGIIGTVDDKLQDLKVKPFSLCRSCHMITNF